MKEKLLSLIVPVYNTAPYLRRCLGSVLDPAVCGAIEVIAVNDGSTDASPAILRDWARRWPDTLTVIDRPNGGHGAAVNTGLRAASGRYVRVLDSDDWLDTPGFIDYVNQLCGCREDLIVTPYTQEFCAEGRELRHDYPFLEDGRVYTLDEIDWREGMDYFCLASSAWRTELLRGCGLALPEHCSYVDMIYALWPIPYLKSFRFLGIPLYRYFIGRAEQSMNGAVLRRQTPMHQRVLTQLIGYYAQMRARITPGARAYMRLVLFYMLHTHGQLLCVEGSGSREAYRAVRALDETLREAPELYEAAQRIPCLRLSRRLGYRNVRFLPRRAVLALRRLRQPGGITGA